MQATGIVISGPHYHIVKQMCRFTRPSLHAYKNMDVDEDSDQN